MRKYYGYSRVLAGVVVHRFDTLWERDKWLDYRRSIGLPSGKLPAVHAVVKRALRAAASGASWPIIVGIEYTEIGV